MTESNATQVILTDDGIKIIQAQDTADQATNGIANLNDPNLMSVIEKQTQASQYAGLTSQYNVILRRAKDAGINTTALTTAYTNLNTFMATILTDTTKASDVDRNTYKSLTDAYNTALSNVQTALSNNFNTDISNMQSSVSAASQAASSAAIVASQAATTGNSASQAASQASSAASQASADYTALSSGVKDGSVVHITTKTVIDNAVIGTAEIVDAAITDAKIGNISANKLTAGTIDFNTITGKNINASNITTGTLSTDRLNVGKLSALSANLGDVTTGSLKGVDIVANSFSTPNGSFTTDSNGAVVASNLTIRGVTNLVYNAALLGSNESNIPGWNIINNGYRALNVVHDGVNSIGWNNTTVGWNLFAQTKLYPLNGVAGQPFSASVWFLEFGSDTSLQYQFTLAFFDSNGNRIDFAGNTWNGISSSQGWRYVTIDNAVEPNNAAYVGLQFWSCNGHGNVLFSSPMLTQSAQSTGYQPDTGNVVSAGEIDGSVINGSIINTPTLNLGLNGTLTTDFDISQDTSLYAPKKGTGTLTIKTGVINSRSQNMSRYSSTEAYWYGFDDNGNMVKDGTNPTGDDYAPGYEKHDIMKSNGNVLNRSYLDAMGLMFTEGGTTTYNTMLTGAGLETATALLHKDLATNGTFNAALGTKNTYGFSIGSQVVSPMIRANSYTYAANMFISSNGVMGVSTSTKANKLDIVDVPDMLQKGYNLLTINPRQWFDKTSVEAYADVQSGNSDSIESVVNIKPITGMVAEEVASAGLDDYVVKDENNKVQGLAYDRLWTLLLPVLRDMNDKINKLQKKEGI